CGLVRSNLALATWCPPQDSVAGIRMDSGCGCWVSIYFSWWISIRACDATRPACGLLALALLDDLVGHSLRDLRVAVERHRVDRTTRGLRAQVTDIAE